MGGNFIINNIKLCRITSWLCLLLVIGVKGDGTEVTPGSVEVGAETPLPFDATTISNKVPISEGGFNNNVPASEGISSNTAAISNNAASNEDDLPFNAQIASNTASGSEGLSSPPLNTAAIPNSPTAGEENALPPNSNRISASEEVSPSTINNIPSSEKEPLPFDKPSIINDSAISEKDSNSFDSPSLYNNDLDRIKKDQEQESDKISTPSESSHVITNSESPIQAASEPDEHSLSHPDDTLLKAAAAEPDEHSLSHPDDTPLKAAAEPADPNPVPAEPLNLPISSNKDSEDSFYKLMPNLDHSTHGIDNESSEPKFTAGLESKEIPDIKSPNALKYSEEPSIDSESKVDFNQSPLDTSSTPNKQDIPLSSVKLEKNSESEFDFKLSAAKEEEQDEFNAKKKTLLNQEKENEDADSEAEEDESIEAEDEDVKSISSGTDSTNFFKPKPFSPDNNKKFESKPEEPETINSDINKKFESKPEGPKLISSDNNKNFGSKPEELKPFSSDNIKAIKSKPEEPKPISSDINKKFESKPEESKSFSSDNDSFDSKFESSKLKDSKTDGLKSFNSKPSNPEENKSINNKPKDPVDSHQNEPLVDNEKKQLPSKELNDGRLDSTDNNNWKESPPRSFVTNFISYPYSESLSKAPEWDLKHHQASEGKPLSSASTFLSGSSYNSYQVASRPANGGGSPAGGTPTSNANTPSSTANNLVASASDPAPSGMPGNYPQQQQPQVIPYPQQQISASPYPSPQGGNYPPSQYPLPQGGNYPPSQYPSPQGGSYPPSQYPSPQGGSYPPSQYPLPQGGIYPPSQYPLPQGGIYPPSQYPLPHGGNYPTSQYPSPQEGSYPSHQGGNYPSQQGITYPMTSPVVSYPGGMSSQIISYPISPPLVGYPLPIYPELMFPHHNTDEFHLVVSNNLRTCMINGNSSYPCRGRCPPCWIYNPTTGHEDCFERTPFGTCPELIGIRDESSLLPKLNANTVHNKGCFRNGDRMQACFPASKCPGCWNTDYRDQAFQCFDYLPGALNMCPLGMNLVNIHHTPSHYPIDESNNDIDLAGNEPYVPSGPTSHNLCYMHGNIQQPCSGNLCPPCWEFSSALSGYSCRDYVSNTLRCSSDNSITDNFGIMQYGNGKFYRTTTCYINGKLGHPCRGQNCPTCWKINYVTRRASCFSRVHEGSSSCPNWDGMIDLIQLGYSNEQESSHHGSSVIETNYPESSYPYDPHSESEFMDPIDATEDQLHSASKHPHPKSTTNSNHQRPNVTLILKSNPRLNLTHPNVQSHV